MCCRSGTGKAGTGRGALGLARRGGRSDPCRAPYAQWFERNGHVCWGVVGAGGDSARAGSSRWLWRPLSGRVSGQRDGGGLSWRRRGSFAGLAQAGAVVETGSERARRKSKLRLLQDRAASQWAEAAAGRPGIAMRLRRQNASRRMERGKVRLKRGLQLVVLAANWPVNGQCALQFGRTTAASPPSSVPPAVCAVQVCRRALRRAAAGIRSPRPVSEGQGRKNGADKDRLGMEAACGCACRSSDVRMAVSARQAEAAARQAEGGPWATTTTTAAVTVAVTSPSSRCSRAGEPGCRAGGVRRRLREAAAAR